MKLKLRTVFISDVHLGNKRSNASLLLDFLYSIETDTLVLAGDIIDIWSMKRKWYWTQEHSNVIRKFLSFAKFGTRVIYIPGNHDDIFRQYAGLQFGDIEIKYEHVHQMADGRRIWVIHGDEFDVYMHPSYRIFAFLGDYIYRFLIFLNRLNNQFRSLSGKEYWSLSHYLKTQTNGFFKVITRYENSLANAAVSHSYDGIICGHIHHGAIKQMGSFSYYNSGDWVDSFTALTEDFSGNIRLLHWSKLSHPEIHIFNNNADQEEIILSYQ